MLAAVLTPVLWGAEHVVLLTGGRLRVERHSTDGPRTTLYYHDGGYTVLPTDQIAGFEPGEAVAAEPPASAPAPQGLVEQAAARNELDPLLVDSVIRAESAYNAAAVSPKGAVGLMQLMPATARELGVADARDPAQNLEGGTAYLRQMLDRYRDQPNRLERALAAYNAGPARVDRHGGLPPYRETVDFVSRVARLLLRGKAAVTSSAALEPRR
jgi:soluble lytic murein transglycosylase-like protein